MGLILIAFLPPNPAVHSQTLHRHHYHHRPTLPQVRKLRALQRASALFDRIATLPRQGKVRGKGVWGGV